VPTTGAITVSKTGGVAFAASATTNTTLTGNINYTQGGTGSVSRTVTSKLQDSVSVLDFGADPTGVADSTAAFTNAIAASKSVVIPPGTYAITSVTTTGATVTIFGYGATVVSTSATGALYKTDHATKLTVLGLTFNLSGSGIGINVNATPSVSTTDELEVKDCTFNNTGSGYSISSVGGREHRFAFCFFNGGSGFYFSQTVSPFITNCIFKGAAYAGNGILYQGTGTGYDAGLLVRDCEILGYNNGIKVVGTQWFMLEGSTVDYNNNSIILGGQLGANISNNYIGSLGANTALLLTYDASVTSQPAFTSDVCIVNNTFTGHYTGGNTYDCITLNGATPPQYTIIEANIFDFYTRYGINFTVVSYLTITNNKFAQRTSFGVSAIYNASGSGDSGVRITLNQFAATQTVAAMNLSFANVQGNIGCATEVKGQGIIAPGAATVSVTLSPSLNYTPSTTDVVLTPFNSPAAVAIPYVQSVNATTLVINTVNVVAGSNAGISYQIRRSI
jgi:hypothetical protein